MFGNQLCLKIWLRLFFKVFFTWKCIKIIFLIFKKLFLISTHQIDLKTQKKNYFEVKKKIKKNLKFFKNTFETQK